VHADPASGQGGQPFGGCASLSVRFVLPFVPASSLLTVADASMPPSVLVDSEDNAPPQAAIAAHAATTNNLRCPIMLLRASNIRARAISAELLPQHARWRNLARVALAC
jgi:hypothetical protein